MSIAISAPTHEAIAAGFTATLDLANSPGSGLVNVTSPCAMLFNRTYASAKVQKNFPALLPEERSYSRTTSILPEQTAARCLQRLAIQEFGP